MARPKRAFTGDEVKQITEMALNNCHLDTIALALDIAKTTLVRRYGTFIKRKRAQGRIRLRQYQDDLAKAHPAMAIFLGKNVLDQTDKQVIEHEDGKQKQLSDAQQAQVEEFLKWQRGRSIKAVQGA